MAMRYAEVYLMKAECILRTNGNAEEAAQLVNEVRKRAFDGDNKLSGADLLKTTNVMVFLYVLEFYWMNGAGNLLWKV